MPSPSASRPPVPSPPVSSPPVSPTAGARDWRRAAPWLLLAAAVLARLAWLAMQAHPRVFLGEADDVALAYTRTGVLADAFQHGQGPTAHLMPLPVLIAGTVYRAFGWQSATSEAILTTWSLAVVLASFFLLFKAFEQLGSPLTWRLVALATLALVPLNFALETVWFRLWDGGLAAALSAAFLYAVLRLDGRAGRIGFTAIAGMALLAAVLFFVSPPMGLAAYLCAALVMVRRVPVRRWFATMATAAVLLIAVLTPWTLRNIAVMHAPIVLRDNFGLELALANYQGAIDTRDPKAEFRAHWRNIHPFASMAAFHKMVAAGGEVAYARQLQAQSMAWIAAHPGGFAVLTLRHIKEILFPPAWYWAFSGDKPGGAGLAVKIVLNDLVSVLGLAGLVWGLRRDFHRYVYVALMTLVPLVPYFFLQPTLRYRYLSIALLVYLSADFLARLTARRARRGGVVATPPPRAYG